jgi:hypothetical protein
LGSPKFRPPPVSHSPVFRIDSSSEEDIVDVDAQIVAEILAGHADSGHS